MRCYIRIILTSVLAVFLTLPAFGVAPSDSVKVYFRVGHRTFDPAFGHNRAVMDSFVNIVREANAENNIERVVVTGYASPDGTSRANERLSRLRCEAIASYIEEHAGLSRDLIRTIAGGIAWTELRQMVDANPDVPSREKVINILDHTPVYVFDAQGKIIDGRKAQLMSLARGVPYNWMMRHLFPELRNATVVSIYLKQDNTPHTDVSATSGQMQHEADSIQAPAIQPENDFSEETKQTYEAEFNTMQPVRNTHNRYFALKTNMLYDAALVPNIGLEFYVGKNISVYGEWMYAWWNNDSRHRYWHVYGGDLGARWWFGRKAHEKPLTGHHVGIYGGILTFDFEFGGTGYMGGKPGGTIWDRCLVNSGIEYGYSLPVGKHLNIDFSIGFGLLAGNYIKYFPFDNDYYRKKEYKLRFFGPTKAEISLVWLLGRGNTNSKKGGEK